MEATVFVEVPMGSRNKYEVDAATGQVVLDRRLFTSMSYPADYGFIEGTLGDDGDPLDALVLVGEPTFPGCRIRGRVVGVFNMTDEKGSDEKIILVPLRNPAWMRVHDTTTSSPSFGTRSSTSSRSTRTSRTQRRKRAGSATGPMPSASSRRHDGERPRQSTARRRRHHVRLRRVEPSPRGPEHRRHEGAPRVPFIRGNDQRGTRVHSRAWEGTRR